MSQHDYNIANQTFPATRTDLNNALGAVATNNSGNSAPSTTYANQWWFDLDDNKLYMRNKDNDAWVEILTIGATSDKVESIGSGGGLTITTADNTDTLSLISTDADASSGPNLRMYRNSSSPADSDVLGVMEYEGRNDNSEDVRYVQLTSQANDVSNGSEDGSYYITTSVAGTLRNRINVIPTEVVVNEEGRDLDFRVESDGNANMLFVNAGAEAVCVGTSSGTGLLNVVAADGVKDADYVVKIENQEATGGRSFGLNLAAGSSGSDIALNVNDHDSANNLMRLFGNGTTAFPSTSAFGIGTSSPAHNLDVRTAASGTDTSLRVSSNAGGDNDATLIISNGGTGDAMIRFDYEESNTDRARIGVTASGQDLKFFTAGNNERMRLTSDGNLLMNTTSSTVNSSNFGIALYYYNVLKISRNVGASSPMFQAYGSGGEFRILGDGDAENTNNSYGAISDERIKENITDANSQWNDIKAIKVRNFERKDDVAKYGAGKKVQIGVVAQQVEAVSPGLIKERDPTEVEIKMSSEFGTLWTADDPETQDGVEAVLYTADDPETQDVLYTADDELPEGVEVGDVKTKAIHNVGDIKIEAKPSTKQIEEVKEVNEQVKSVNYSVLYMKAVKALQEAMDRIETLESKVATLEGE